jgi:hypothetical protein
MYKETKQEESVKKEQETDQSERKEYEQLDEHLMQTFPASDPISYY